MKNNIVDFDLGEWKLIRKKLNTSPYRKFLNPIQLKSKFPWYGLGMMFKTKDTIKIELFLDPKFHFKFVENGGYKRYKYVITPFRRNTSPSGLRSGNFKDILKKFDGWLTKDVGEFLDQHYFENIEFNKLINNKRQKLKNNQSTFTRKELNVLENKINNFEKRLKRHRKDAKFQDYILPLFKNLDKSLQPLVISKVMWRIYFLSEMEKYFLHMKLSDSLFILLKREINSVL